MRQGRSQSRNSSRTKSPSPSVGNAAVSKKATKLPQIGGAQDELVYSSSPRTPPGSGLQVGVCSQQGKRPYQEDEYAVRPYLNQSSPDQDNAIETHFFGLFDGHAGGKCSNFIATSLPNVLAEDSSFFTNLPQALKRSYHLANEHFLKIAEKMKYHDGSTGISAVIRDTKVLVANVGDCRALIISCGRPIQMSIDQKPTNPEEQKRIAALGGQVVYCMGVARVNRVLAVSRAFGNRTLRSVIRPDAEMMQRELTKDDDYLVLASDGLWDVLKNKDVCDMCYSPFLQGNPQTIADELVNTALLRGSMDNVTCVVVRLTEYVQKVLSGRLNGVNGIMTNTNGQNVGGVQQPSGPLGNNNALGTTPQSRTDVPALEKSASLKNVASTGSGRYSSSDQPSASQNNNGMQSGNIPSIARQFSLGSLQNNYRAGEFNGISSVLPQNSSTGFAPVIDNYLSGTANLRSGALDHINSNVDSNSNTFLNSPQQSQNFHLPSPLSGGSQGTGFTTIGVAGTLRPQPSHVSPHSRAGSVMLGSRSSSGSGNEDDLTDSIHKEMAHHPNNYHANSSFASNGVSAALWNGGQPVAGSHSGFLPPASPGANGTQSFAARRPNTTSNGSNSNSSIQNASTRGSFSGAMPNLISMFGSTIPMIGHQQGNNTNHVPLFNDAGDASPSTHSQGNNSGWSTSTASDANDFSGSSNGSSNVYGNHDHSGNSGYANGRNNGGGRTAGAVATNNRSGGAGIPASTGIAAIFPINYRPNSSAKK